MRLQSLLHLATVVTAAQRQEAQCQLHVHVMLVYLEGIELTEHWTMAPRVQQSDNYT